MAVFELRNFDFGKFQPLKNETIHQNQISEPPKDKLAVFERLRSLRLI